MFNQLAKEIHEGNKSRGFWESERKLTEVVMLAHVLDGHYIANHELLDILGNVDAPGRVLGWDGNHGLLVEPQLLFE